MSVECYATAGRWVTVVPASRSEDDLAQARGFAPQDQLFLHAAQEELLELVEVRRGIDHDRERAAVQGVQGAVIAQALFHQLLPGQGDLAQFALAFLDGLLEETDHFLAELHRGNRRGLLDLLQALEGDEFTVGAREGHGSTNKASRHWQASELASATHNRRLAVHCRLT